MIDRLIVSTKTESIFPSSPNLIPNRLKNDKHNRMSLFLLRPASPPIVNNLFIFEKNMESVRSYLGCLNPILTLYSKICLDRYEKFH